MTRLKEASLETSLLRKSSSGKGGVHSSSRSAELHRGISGITVVRCKTTSATVLRTRRLLQQERQEAFDDLRPSSAQILTLSDLTEDIKRQTSMARSRSGGTQRSVGFDGSATGSGSPHHGFPLGGISPRARGFGGISPRARGSGRDREAALQRSPSGVSAALAGDRTPEEPQVQVVRGMYYDENPAIRQEAWRQQFDSINREIEEDLEREEADKRRREALAANSPTNGAANASAASVGGAGGRFVAGRASKSPPLRAASAAAEDAARAGSSGSSGGVSWVNPGRCGAFGSGRTPSSGSCTPARTVARKVSRTEGSAPFAAQRGPWNRTGRCRRSCVNRGGPQQYRHGWAVAENTSRPSTSQQRYVSNADGTPRTSDAGSEGASARSRPASAGACALTLARLLGQDQDARQRVRGQVDNLGKVARTASDPSFARCAVHRREKVGRLQKCEACMALSEKKDAMVSNGGSSMPHLAAELLGIRDDYYSGDELQLHEDILYSSNPQLFPLRPGFGKPFPLPCLANVRSSPSSGDGSSCSSSSGSYGVC